MSGKHSTPRRGHAAGAVKRRAAARTQELAAFRERLQHLVQLHGGSRTAFAKLLGVGTSHVSKWCDGGTAPTASILHRIADRTGVSIDWLLGYDVPPERDRRAAAGALADVLQAELLRRAPYGGVDPGAFERELADVRGAHSLASSATLLDSIASAWWHARLVARASLWGRRLLAMAAQLEIEQRRSIHDLPTPASDLGFTTAMRHTIAELRDSAHLLERQARDDEANAWWRLLDLEELQPLRDPMRDLRTPFDTLGGVGFAYRGADADYAWYLHPVTGAVEEREGRFLESNEDELDF